MKRKMIAFGGIVFCAVLLLIYSKTDAIDPLKKTQRAATAHIGEVSEALDNDEYDGAIIYSEDNINKISEEMDESDVFEVGETVMIQSGDIDLYEDFYLRAGSKNSRDDAIKYAEERAALYAEAIENGFSVTDSEVTVYVNDLKKILNETVSKEVYENIISGFESEEAYWDYEKNLYKYDLPITKYAESLKEEYRNKVKVEDDMEFEEMWQEEYQRIKNNLVKEQNYSKL